ncbi:MAG: site-2 protease family protein [Patescibacteria group bacterium]
MQSIEAKIFIYVIVIMSAIFHEYAHAWTAYYLGDPTAKNAGRLTLNPIAHIDPFGTVLLPLFLLFTGGIFIGYAKPVPFNPYNLNDQKYGSVKVAMAGPGSNFLIAILLSLVLRSIALPPFWGEAVVMIVYVNIILGLFNLIPVPPLDGSKLLKRFTSFDFSFGNSFLGTIIALMLAFTFMPYLAQGVFQILTGMTI